MHDRLEEKESDVVAKKRHLRLVLGKYHSYFLPLGESLLRVRDVCKFLCVSRTKVYSLMADGELEWVKIRRVKWIKRRSLIEFLKRNDLR